MAVGIQGVIGAVTGGTSLLNAILVQFQGVNFDVKSSDNVAFLFAYRGEDGIELASDITDNFVEDNTARQDQIALKPEIISVNGFIGELTDQTQGFANQVRQLASQLTVLSPYAPALTAQALTVYNQARQVYDSVSSAASTLLQAYDMIVGNDLQNKQQKAFGYFYKKWKDRALFTVQTPWAIFEDMAILSLRANQEEGSNNVSDFSIRFKKINFADSLLATSAVSQGRRFSQISSVVNQGFQNPPTTTSMAGVLSGGTVFTT